MIRKVGKQYRLASKATGKPLGPKRASKKAVQKDEKRVRFFANLAKSSGGAGSLASKVKKKSLLKKTVLARKK